MAMNTYTAFNIGPIYTTFIMGRRPRELWAASYMFSYLMKCIYDNVPKGSVLSPAEVPCAVLRAKGWVCIRTVCSFVVQ